MKPNCKDEAEICESVMAPVSMPRGMLQTAGRKTAVRRASAKDPEQRSQRDNEGPRGGNKKRCMVRKRVASNSHRGWGPMPALTALLELAGVSLHAELCGPIRTTTSSPAPGIPRMALGEEGPQMAVYSPQSNKQIYLKFSKILYGRSFLGGV